MGEALRDFLKAEFSSLPFVLNFRIAGDRQSAVFIHKVRAKTGPYYEDEVYSLTAANVIPGEAIRIAQECYLLLLRNGGFPMSGKKALIKNQTGPQSGGMDANGIAIVQFSFNFICKR